MQILHLPLAEYDLYNCVTGEQITSNDEGVCNSVSLMAMWDNYETVKDSPWIKDKHLKKAWDEFLLKTESRGYSEIRTDELEQFLKDYDNPKWVVYVMCPDEVTGWYVIDVDPPM
jgi:hypothetical protein